MAASTIAPLRTTRTIAQKGLLEVATDLKRLIEEARRFCDFEALFDLEVELDEIEEAMYRAWRSR